MKTTKEQIIKAINDLRIENTERRKQGFALAQEFIQYGIEYAKRFGELMQLLEKAA